MTNHVNHYSKFRVQRRCNWNKWLSSRQQWQVLWPTDPSSDYQESKWFTTFDEAMEFAQLEAFKVWVGEQFSNYVYEDNNARVLRAAFMELRSVLQ